jgi:hypothetical protein
LSSRLTTSRRTRGEVNNGQRLAVVQLLTARRANEAGPALSQPRADSDGLPGFMLVAPLH